MNYKSKSDFPMKCDRCGAGRSHMIRSGYMDTRTQKMKYKRFMCKVCKRIMLRLVKNPPKVDQQSEPKRVEIT